MIILIVRLRFLPLINLFFSRIKIRFKKIISSSSITNIIMIDPETTSQIKRAAGVSSSKPKKRKSEENAKRTKKGDGGGDGVVGGGETDAGGSKGTLASSAEEEAATWESLGVCPELTEAVTLMKWSAPTPIQREVLPWALQGRDIIALAETGSGKTGAFAIPIVQQLLDNPQRFFAVVLAPTRELCVQIGEQFQALGSGISLMTATIVGGLDMVTQAMALAKRPHVIVASPGRLVDHLENTKGFHLKSIKFLVMDEADRILSMDFDEALDKILQVVPRERNTYLFSATMTSKVTKLQRASLRKPVKCEVSTKYDTVKTLVQNYLFIPWKYKHTYLASLISHFKHYSVMVFTDTCASSQKLTVMMRHLGFASVCLHGQMNQTQRLGALNHFKAGDKRILICTDVASRGLDIPLVDLVVNCDIPKNSKDYIHRVGRTARAGRSGRAMTMVTQYDVEAFQRVEHFLGHKLDEFKDLKEEAVMANHERVSEAARTTELEMRENETGEGGGRGAKRKLQQLRGKAGHKKGKKRKT